MTKHKPQYFGIKNRSDTPLLNFFKRNIILRERNISLHLFFCFFFFFGSRVGEAVQDNPMFVISQFFSKLAVALADNKLLNSATNALTN